MIIETVELSKLYFQLGYSVQEAISMAIDTIRKIEIEKYEY